MRILSLIVLAILLSFLSFRYAVDPPKPEVKSIEPLGIPAGKTTRIVLYGENLNPKTLSIKSPITVKLIESKATDEKTKAKGTRQVVLEAVVPANCPRDSFELTLANPDGTKTTAMLPVVESVVVEVPIKKPASAFEQAMPLPGPSVAITGQLDGDAPDLISFTAKTGETYDLTLLAGRGGSQLDAVLRDRDSRRLSRALSVGNKKKDRHISFHPPVPGLYYIEITEAEAKGGAGYNYRLTILRKGTPVN